MAKAIMSTIKKDRILDLEGIQTGIPASKGFLISLFSSLTIYLIVALVDPIAEYGLLASKALGFFIACIVFMVTSGVSLAPIAMLVATLGVMIGFFEWGTVTARLGSSQLYNMMGMLIVATGCEFTPLGRRISYLVLRQFGQKPIRMLIFIGVAAATMSALISNVAVIILYSSVMNSLLLAMDEKPGESKLGKVMMLIIPMCACIGGMALFCGSPVGNAAALSYMTSAIGDESFAATFTQWASISIPTFLISIVPAILFYIKWFKVKNQDCNCPPKEYYENLLKELGPMGGAEIRWIIITVGMVIAMLLGVKTAFAAILFAGISVFPIIGVAPCQEVLKKLPWNALIAICILPLLGTIITDTGLSDWISHLIGPMMGNMSPLAFSMIAAVLLAILANLLVNAMMGAMALVMSISAPLCVALGYNPTIILLPAAFAASFYWCMGVNQYVAINKDYGWWEMKDPILPGLITAISVAIIASIVACTLGPVFGMPLYL